MQLAAQGTLVTSENLKNVNSTSLNASNAYCLGRVAKQTHF
jgi:hypothetical protein